VLLAPRFCPKLGPEADGCVVSNAPCPPPTHLCPICRRREALREELPPRRSCLDASRSCRVDRPCAVCSSARRLARAFCADNQAFTVIKTVDRTPRYLAVRRRGAGFTLLEISLVLVIIGTVMGGIMVTLTASLQTSQFNATVARMERFSRR
jgi:prepilin-type N-terminal cleavage/methylation domain-containing protein